MNTVHGNQVHDEDRQARAIAERIRLERETRGWSLAELAARSGVSKAMISKVERCEASPTATVLGRLSGAFGLPLSVLLALAEREGDRLARRDEQPLWIDPDTGYTRRTLSPGNGGQLELLEVVLPPGVRVPYPASAFSFQHQQIYVLEGRLDFIEGTRSHQLSKGDCLQLGAPSDCVFINSSDQAIRYLVALTRRG
ncbi:Transcriptional regulator, contains XRE-family HTH domain [Rhizobium sp. RU33A]|uniref:helix-turn-helix domain-containing protein n=1 Tax=Rhizobium sp. RU33A TaxID=1907413 RepID=UPI000955B125|nr:XRE family transcriptional regulator [Rhizobium sp. RU33A]SIQ07103.1 Transcriptional regulator, contains XRE-family HTH domain [Rhizobium sp. RU33A]